MDVEAQVGAVIGAIALLAAEGGDGGDPPWVTIGVGVLGALATLASTLITVRYQNRKRDDSRRSKIKGNELTLQGITEKDSFSALDVLKVLDLRDGPDVSGRGSGGRAVLSDSYLVMREKESGNGLVFCYATSGSFDSAKSTSLAWKWGRMQPHSPLKPGVRATTYGLGVDLENLSVDHVARVTNEVVYRGAFDQPDSESLETHVDRSTRSLTFVILFPPSYPCVSAVGEEDTVREQWARVEGNRPVILEDGQCLYWRVFRDDAECLPHRARYRLRWDWRPATAATTPQGTAATAAGTS